MTIKPNNLLDFGTLCIGQEVTKYINIKHSTKNSATAVHVVSEGFEGLTCNGKFVLKQEDSHDVEAKYKAVKEGEFTGHITLKVRGSKDRVIECKAKCVQPNITC